MKLNQSGSTQLFLCLLLLMSLSGVTIVTLNKLTLLKNNRMRLKTLLCLRKSQFYQTQFTYDINLSNRIIQVAFYATKIPIPKVSMVAKITLNSFKIKQQLDLIKFYKDIYNIKECSKITRGNIVLNSLYKMKAKVVFIRNYDQTTLLSKDNKKSYLYFTSEKLTFKLPQIIFKSTFSLDNHFDKRVKVFTEELRL